MFKEAGRWGIACYEKQNRHSKKKHTSRCYCKATRTNKKDYKMKNARPAQVRQWLRRGNGVSFRRFIPRARHLPSQGATWRAWQDSFGRCHTGGDSHTSCRPHRPSSQDDGQTYCSKLPPQTKVSLWFFFSSHSASHARALGQTRQPLRH